ncbi:hypothetical protein Tco_0140616 [Tanacetum coccineum]
MSQPANDEFSQHLSDDKNPTMKDHQKLEHYLEYIDNDVWKVIQNGNSKKRISSGKDGIVRILLPVTAAEIHVVEKERKAKNILLMAIPKEHMRRFHGMDDAKEIWEAIRTRPIVRNTARMTYSHAVKGNWGSAIKTSAGYNWRSSNSNCDSVPTFIRIDHPLKNMVDRGIFDSGCSGHMTELGNFNLFSISQICDKQHKVLFTETECLVVSSDFKMPDENQILLKVPRHHNMYNFDMKTLTPAKGKLTVLGTSQLQVPNAFDEKDEDVRAYCCAFNWRNTKKKLNPRKSSTNQRKQDLEQTFNKRKGFFYSSTDTSEDNPKILAFRRELEEIALKHLGNVSENTTTSTPSVNTGSEPVNTGSFDPDDSPTPELKIFHKSDTGIFDEASYYEEGVITDFNSLPTEIEVSPTPTLRIHNIHPKSQILGDPKSAMQTRSKVQQKSGAHALFSFIQKQQRNNFWLTKVKSGSVNFNTGRLLLVLVAGKLTFFCFNTVQMLPLQIFTALLSLTEKLYIDKV